jgi:hypothetical protein
MSEAATVTAAELASAAHDVRQLILHAPERLWWVPGRAWWGLALAAGGTRVVVALDGCLAIGALTWPGHIVPGGRYPLAALARRLAEVFTLQRVADAALFACPLPGARGGHACVLMDGGQLPWLAAVPQLLPLTDVPTWQAPADPGTLTAPPPLHPWVTMAGSRPAASDAGAFLAALGEPPACQLLPAAQRAPTLTAHWRWQFLHEAERLRFAGLPAPSWLAEADLVEHAARAWVDGRRASAMAEVPAWTPSP